MDLLVVRLLFIAVVTLTCFVIKPFNLPAQMDAVVGAAIGFGIVLFEWKLRRVSLKRLIGAAIGSVLGIIGAYLFALVLRNSLPAWQYPKLSTDPGNADHGLRRADRRRDEGRHAKPGGTGWNLRRRKAGQEKPQDSGHQRHHRWPHRRYRRTGFLDGIIVTPQFVLRELQLVADSADSLKRNRGRRGLDILQRLQKVASLQIQIDEEDFPRVREVDLKLIELAKVYEGKIITNDFNLNKVAQLQGVEVLNINELANALKPIVLPGETMKVFILKEGKEYNQGVAYLDDGTMVVVDNARKMIGKTIDVSVTSVLQTTAGKMIFGKWDERTAPRGEHRAPLTPISTTVTVEPKKPQSLMAERPAEQG